eukprot:scaffold435_cov342-Pavlova_lutheri.AAC.25
MLDEPRATTCSLPGGGRSSGGKTDPFRAAGTHQGRLQSHLWFPSTDRHCTRLRSTVCTQAQTVHE